GGGCGLRGDGHDVSFWVGYRRTGVSAGRTADGEIRRGDLGGRSGWERSECGPGPAVEHSAAEATVDSDHNILRCRHAGTTRCGGGGSGCERRLGTNVPTLGGPHRRASSSATPG